MNIIQHHVPYEFLNYTSDITAPINISTDWYVLTYDPVSRVVISAESA